MRTKHAPGRNFARILEKGESLVGATYFLATFQTFFPLQHFFNLLPMVDVVRELWDRECSSGRQNASSHGGGPCSWCASEMRNLQSGSPEVKRPPIASCDVSHERDHTLLTLDEPCPLLSCIKCALIMPWTP
jgi:hypothetical protein